MAAHPTQRKPYDYQIENYSEFLHAYRYSLANIIEVKHAIPWLMHNDVIDKIDEEQILLKYDTSVLRAGDLIDMVNRRGPHAFNALMEFIEYEYPEIFQMIMGRQAREPDPSVYVPAWQKSTHISKDINDGIHLIMQAFDVSKTTSAKAQASIKDLEMKIQDVENQLEMKREQILDLSHKVLELDTHNKELTVQLQQVKEERDEAVKTQEMFRQERDKYRAEVQMQKEKLMKVLLDPVTNGSSGRSKQTNESVQLLCEVKCLERQLDTLADEYDLFRSSYLEQVKSVTQERDQILRQHEELKRKCESLQEENKRLNEELQGLHRTERINKAESSIRRMRNTGKSKSVVGEQDQENGCICSNRTENGASSDCRGDDRDVTNFQTTRTQNAILRNDRVDESSKTFRNNLKEPPRRNVPVVGTVGVTVKHHLNTGPTFWTIRKHQGEKKHALVLFAPDPLQHDLHRHLLSEYSCYFSPCPYEVLCDEHLEILPKWLEAGRCIHYRDLGGGKYYCLGSDILDILLHSDTCLQVLLDLPVEAVPRMMKQNISTYILIIKYKHLETEGKKSKDELEIEKICKEYSCHYEKFLIDQNSSIESVASIIAHNFAMGSDKQVTKL